MGMLQQMQMLAKAIGWPAVIRMILDQVRSATVCPLSRYTRESRRERKRAPVLRKIVATLAGTGNVNGSVADDRCPQRRMRGSFRAVSAEEARRV